MRVGIDLGTTNTVVCYVDENGLTHYLDFINNGSPVEFLINESSERKYFLPSCVAVKNGRVVVGQEAVEYGMENPADFFCNTKGDMKTPDKRLDNAELTPIAAAEAILNEAYSELQSQFPDEREFNAFVTVPTRFPIEARLATKEALKRSAFVTDEHCLTDEPIAAAIAYSSRLDGGRVILVVDIGGGTFDLSLLKTHIIGTSTNPDKLEPVAWDADNDLGGKDVDDILVRKMTEKFRSVSGIDLYGQIFADEKQTAAAALLRSKTLTLKKQLYAEGSDKASVLIPDLYNGYDLDFVITANEYEREMEELTNRMSDCINNLFVGNAYSKSQVDHVLVVGGMAHEICLQKLLRKTFGSGRILIPDDSMMLVSRGAAICNSDFRLEVDNRAYSSIGLLKNSGQEVSDIIKEGASIKAGATFEGYFTLADDDATAFDLELVEYRGAFSSNKYTTIKKEKIQLSRRKSWKNLLPISKLRIGLKIVFSEDKIFTITVTQPDGTNEDISIRLGGKQR